MKKRVLIKGPILTQSGYGEHARAVYRALKTRPDLFEIFVEPLTWGKTSWLWEDDKERNEIDEAIGKTQFYISEHGGQFDIALLVTIPNEWKRIAPITIGVTAGIESSKVAPQWIEKANQEVDKIIVVSEFSKKIFLETKYNMKHPETGQALELQVEKLIDVVNYPVKQFNEVDLGLDLEYDFNFLCVAQWGPRKNIEQTILCFLEEFKNEEVGLVLKLNRANNSLGDRVVVESGLRDMLAEFPDRKCKIYLLHGYMRKDEIHSLYVHPKIKALLSLTHGEGFGLPIFEAVYCGLPVVTHDWGGQTDFLYKEEKNKKGKTKKKPYYTRVEYDIRPIQKEAVWESVLQADSMWAFPRKNSVKEKIRHVYKQYDIRKNRAGKLKEHVLKNFTAEKIANDYIGSILNEDLSQAPEAEYIFISDAFEQQFPGGAEKSLQTLVESCPSSNIMINSSRLTEQLLEHYKDSKWIFGNMTYMNFDFFPKLVEKNIQYSFIEFDYKYCKHRNPALYKFVEGEECEYSETDLGKKISNFIKGANSVFFMSEKQKELYVEHLPETSKANLHVLSSLFGDDFFEYIEKLNEKKYEKDKWVVLGSDSWVKGVTESEEWCKENEMEYEIIQGLNSIEFLKKLANSEGICFKPTGLDTCPRFVIEAKLLGCELELNENVQHTEEQWFNSSTEDMVTHLKTRKDFFWQKSFG